jgi:hypothetical protein
MTKNIACRIFKEQIELLKSLPNQEEAKEVLYRAVMTSYNQFENQNDNQFENQNENTYISLSLLSNNIFKLLSKNIVFKEYNNNYGGKRENSGRKKTDKSDVVKEITNDNKCYQMITNDNIKIKENKNNNYGELGNVKLTEEQYKTLSDKYTNLDLAIEKLDTWLGTSGSKNKNKNHFAYFKSNSWVWENLKEKTENISYTSSVRDKEQENLSRLAELTKKKLEEDMLKRFDKNNI